MHGDADLDGDVGGDGHGGVDIFKVLSLRAIIAGGMFFGLGGLVALEHGAPDPLASGIAAGSGVVALILVGLALNLVMKLAASGSEDVRNAVGASGSVYVPVPAGNSGKGKVMITMQGRSVEIGAVTPGAALPTGTPIAVTKVIDRETVEVGTTTEQVLDQA
jgi:hypothetical protein